jgi:DNA topoisomerase-1
MAKNLVIVESPTKAKTISKFLGKNYIVESSFGHLRDLPKSKLGIDLDKNYTPEYVVPKEKQARVTALKKKAKQADLVYFATDEDREGEAISWHLDELFGLPSNKTKRITFHEITKDAILKSLESPRQIDLNLVDAQQARRILDRLVGYKLSPFLWQKVARGLSAGRVQSVALRLIAEREREIEKFVTQEYWTLEAEFNHQKSDNFIAKLNKVAGKTLDKLDLKTKDELNKILENLKSSTYSIVNLEKREKQKQAPEPFVTSTLQRTANTRFGYSAKQIMMLAQQLYEGISIDDGDSVGLITYMRTDSLNLSQTFVDQARHYLNQKLGQQYIPAQANVYKTKSKGAQEAHEAIRPTNIELTPEKVKSSLNAKQFKLYNLIWQRAVASQMNPAILEATTVDILDNSKKYNFRANGSVIKFDGFLKIYPTKTEENFLPKLEINNQLDLQELKPEQHFTQPPARFSEAGLIKILEEYGIGRPSTYAPTISTIITRNYVEKFERRLKPTEIGLLVNDVLVEHFPKVVDYQFTAQMENELDEIAGGQLDWHQSIDKFYKPFINNLENKMENVSKKELTEETTDEKCDKCGSPMVIKMGRFGKFLACSNYPECKNTKQIGTDGKPAEPETTDEKCDKCGSPMLIKQGRYGSFLACSNYPECKNTKPIVKSTGVQCPLCGKGQIVEKRSKAGKTFYACDQYPNCKNAYWSKPTGEKCPNCGSLLVYGANNTARCSAKECKFSKDLE